VAVTILTTDEEMTWMQEISDTLGIEVSSFKIEEVDKLIA